VWPQEIQKWADFSDISFTILHGPDKVYNVQSDCDVYFINPEGLKWLFESQLKLPTWDILVIDESTKFKDSQSKRFKLLKHFLPLFTRRWILTGTPVPNGLEDLFGQIYILDQGRSLGRFITHFRQKYFLQNGYLSYDRKVRPGAFEEVTEVIAPLVLRLKAEDYLEMPERVNVNVSVDLPPEARKIYRQVEKDFVSLQEKGAIVAANAAVAGIKCRQIANGAVYGEGGVIHEIHQAKLEALESLLEEIGHSPTLILYEFNHDKERILKAIGDTPVLGSGVSTSRFSRLVDRFNAGDIPRLLGHPASMGHGLNLQGSCHHCVWFGIPWDLDLYDQAIARIYRQGQNSSRVFVYHVVAKATKDEEALEVLSLKDRTQQDLLRAVARYRKEHLDVQAPE
jgi:SNF2 family DNA or RNA helicase